MLLQLRICVCPNSLYVIIITQYDTTCCSTINYTNKNNLLKLLESLPPKKELTNSPKHVLKITQNNRR